MSNQSRELINLIYSVSVEEAIRMMETSLEGLSNREVSKRVELYGKNTITKKQGKSTYIKFLESFTSLMAILLWVGAIIAFGARIPELGVAICLVNLINGSFSFWQEFRAEKATEELMKILPKMARVLRAGEEIKILAEELVPGDIILLEEGDMITADARILHCDEFQVNQSTLTGESNPARKQIDSYTVKGNSILEAKNLVFAGTSCSSGTAICVVVETGMNTELGKIADLTMNVKEELSPLQKELNRLTKRISVFTIGIGIAFFVAATLLVDMPLISAFIYSLGMIVAFIPEGLLPTVTLSLAMAVQRMAKSNALVKKLSAVETLGCTTVICTDKTGTLTQNEMTVVSIWTPDRELQVSGEGYSPQGKITWENKEVLAEEDLEMNLVLTAGGMCSNARVIHKEGEEKYQVLGDPTEACLVVVAKKAGIDIYELTKSTPRLKELPFDSKRKRMSTIHKLEQELFGFQYVAYVKGAPKEISELCSKEICDNKLCELTKERREQIIEANDNYARQGLRVLGIAIRLFDEKYFESNSRDFKDASNEGVEQDLVFLGLVAMEDPPKEEVAEAIAKCHSAGIRVIMITGDYGLTAESIGKHIGLINEAEGKVITGTDLEKLSDSELRLKLTGNVIFARVAPEQKYRVVTVLQEMGHIVAVTGDGVNDAPALKKADIGVAMGQAGTDVAKEAADIILTDDNFASIVKAIEEGRAVYANIKKFILYILNSNMPEGVPTIAFLFSGGRIPLPLTMMQILAIDLGTDMLPALGLGAELPEKGVMEKPPRSQKVGFLDRPLFVKAFLYYGMLEAGISLGAYFYVNYLNGWPSVPLASEGAVYMAATTMSLASIVFCQIGIVMNARTEKESIFTVGVFSNKKILLGIFAEIVILILIIYVPFLQKVFGTSTIGIKEWIFLISIPAPLIAIEELRKLLIRKTGRK